MRVHFSPIYLVVRNLGFLNHHLAGYLILFNLRAPLGAQIPADFEIYWASFRVIRVVTVPHPFLLLSFQLLVQPVVFQAPIAPLNLLFLFSQILPLSVVLQRLLPRVYVALPPFFAALVQVLQPLPILLLPLRDVTFRPQQTPPQPRRDLFPLVQL